eukprot:5262817-Pyramimonas_sp.AAC.1
MKEDLHIWEPRSEQGRAAPGLTGGPWRMTSSTEGSPSPPRRNTPCALQRYPSSFSGEAPNRRRTAGSCASRKTWQVAAAGPSGSARSTQTRGCRSPWGRPRGRRAPCGRASPGTRSP